jgi:DNA-binding HxlR family transcriptional regulator
MLRNDYEGPDCSIARALEIVGERWTLLSIRDAFLGLRHLDQFQPSLGIARNVPTDRLNRLVEEAILDRVRYSERPERHEYRLTAKGRDLAVTLAGLRHWGDKHLSDKPRITHRRSDKRPVIAAFVTNGADVLREDEIESVPRSRAEVKLRRERIAGPARTRSPSPNTPAP